jgi:hypothetical protein
LDFLIEILGGLPGFLLKIMLRIFFSKFLVDQRICQAILKHSDLSRFMDDILATGKPGTPVTF